MTNTAKLAATALLALGLSSLHAQAATLLECAKATGGRVITVEYHYPEGRRPLSCH